MKKHWWDFVFTHKAYNNVKRISPSHLCIIWTELETDYPDITDKEINEILSDRDQIARLVGCKTWEEVLGDCNPNYLSEPHLQPPQ